MRKFAAVCSAYLVSMLGSALSSFALSVWIYQVTHSATWFGFSFVLSLLPGLLMSPMAGNVIDRWGQWPVLVISEAVGIFTTLALAALFFTHHLAPWHILITGAIRSVLRAVQVPALNSSVALLVPAHDLARANGLLMTATAIAQTIAPLAGGAILVAVGLTGILIIDAISYLVIVIALMFNKIPAAAPHPHADGEQPTTSGWRYLTSHAALFQVMLLYAALNLGVGVADVVFTPLILGFTTPAMLGIILSIGGVGMILGGMLLTAWGGPRHRIHGLAGFAIPLGLSFCLGSLRPNIILITAAVFGFMFCSTIVDGTSRHVLQTEVPAPLQGRVFALFNMVTNAVLLITYLCAGIIADKVFEPLLTTNGALVHSLDSIFGVGPGRGTALYICLVGVMILLVAAAAYASPALRGLPPRPTRAQTPAPADATGHAGS